MVVSLTRETCLPNLGWAVLRFAGGDWRLVMKRDGFATVSKVGASIREEVPIFRQGDSPCNPTGGTKTRTWRWNGSRFVASAWKKDTKGAVTTPTGTSGYFKTPSGNIQCYGSGQAPVHVVCGILSGLKPPSLERAGCVSRVEVSLRPTGRTNTICSC